MNILFEVSFCIPTYNNCESVERLVRKILEYPSKDIEVVVLDNGSTDDTLKRLNNIVDSRLNIYSNGVNKGALYNMLNVLDKGKGKYIAYCTDHDHVDPSKIQNFLKFLQRNESISCGYCEYDSSDPNKIELFKSGYVALSKLGYITRHPTGFFFKRDLWKLVNPVNRFSDFEIVDLFPLEFVFAELSLLGDGAIYHDFIFAPERGERVKKHKSSTTNGKSKTAFFSPLTRLKLAVNFNKHLNTLSITKQEIQSLMIDSFYRELYASTLGYKGIMLNEAVCEHYYMESRSIGRNELFKIALDFYNGYNDSVIKFNNISSGRRMKFRICLVMNLFPKLIKKVNRWSRK